MSNNSPGLIRPSTDEDKPRIHEIAVAAWKPIFDRYRLILGDRIYDDVYAGWDENWFADASGIVTDINGQVAGFSTCHFDDSEVKALGEVGGNAVGPEFQSRGIGTIQTRAVINTFREKGYRCAKVRTGLDPAHGPARAEYRKAGLRLGASSSLYYNYLDEVARIPVPSSLSFRWAEPEDATLISEMTRMAWTTVYESIHRLLGDDIFAICFESKNELDQKVEAFAAQVSVPQTVRLVMENGKPAGLAILNTNADQKLGQIDALAVQPEFRDRGIGCAICMDAFDLFREKGMCYARLVASPGEVSEQTRKMCWAVGLYRELPSVDYYMML